MSSARRARRLLRPTPSRRFRRRDSAAARSETHSSVGLPAKTTWRRRRRSTHTARDPRCLPFRVAEQNVAAKYDGEDQTDRRVPAVRSTRPFRRRLAIVKAAGGATASPRDRADASASAESGETPSPCCSKGTAVARRKPARWRLERRRRVPVRSRRTTRSEISAKRPSRAARERPLVRARRALRFVVQMHRATRLHYDFRLEADGVLASWAVPKGPTLAPGDRRFAMHVEDHPLDYRDFEGNIPEGQYGAGSVIVWDKGTYALAEGDDPADEIANGKIKFVLHGKKLHGEFTLVKIKPREHESGDPWLLIKDQRRARRSEVRSGRPSRVGQERQDARRRRARSARENLAVEAERASRRGCRHEAAARERQARPAFRIRSRSCWRRSSTILSTTPSGCSRSSGTAIARSARSTEDSFSLVSRNGLDMLRRFPELDELADAFASLPVVVDGEIVSLDAEGRSEFQRLQESQKKPAGLTYVAFDLLYADGTDLRSKPLEERKALLERLIRERRLVLYSKHIVGKGKALYDVAQKQRLEGIIGKKRDSTYQERRSRDWVKIKTGHEQEFVVGGWTEPKGSRSGFGALLLGVYREGRAALRRLGRDGVHREDAGRSLTSGCARSSARRRRSSIRSTPTHRGIGFRPSSSSKCASPSGRATDICASPPIWGCVQTSRRRTSSPSFRWTSDGRAARRGARRIAHALALESR